MAKTLQMQRRLASQVLGVGRNKVWFNPERINDIKEALTSLDIQELINDNAIKSRDFPVKKIKIRKKKTKRGVGKVRMKVRHRKRDYVRLIRKLRKYLKYLKVQKKITNPEFKHLRKLARAKQFKSLGYLKIYLHENLKQLGEKIMEKQKRREEKGAVRNKYQKKADEKAEAEKAKLKLESKKSEEIKK